MLETRGGSQLEQFGCVEFVALGRCDQSRQVAKRAWAGPLAVSDLVLQDEHVRPERFQVDLEDTGESLEERVLRQTHRVLAVVLNREAGRAKQTRAIVVEDLRVDLDGERQLVHIDLVGAPGNHVLDPPQPVAGELIDECVGDAARRKSVVVDDSQFVRHSCLLVDGWCVKISRVIDHNILEIEQICSDVEATSAQPAGAKLLEGGPRGTRRRRGPSLASRSCAARSPSSSGRSAGRRYELRYAVLDKLKVAMEGSRDVVRRSQRAG